MSWLTAVTGKAEDFLNKLDKSAADVLTHEEGEEGEQDATNKPSYTPRLAPSSSVPSQLHTLNENNKESSFRSSSLKKSNKTKSSGTSGAGSQFSANTSTTQSTTKPPKAKKTDDALFDFLNSTESESNKKRRTPVSSRHHSRQSSTSSIKSSNVVKSENVSDAWAADSNLTQGSAWKPSRKHFFF